MPIVLNTAPINVKDSDGNYVTLNSFSMDSLNNIKNQTRDSITEINSATESKVADIDTAKTEAINAVNETINAIDEAVNDAVNEALNNESNGALKQIDDAKDIAISSLKLLKVEISAYHNNESGSATSYNTAGMTEDMALVHYIIDDPASLITDLNIITSNNAVIISGSTIKTISLILYFLPLKETI